MTQEEIIRMAREAGLGRIVGVYADGQRIVEVPNVELLERFAALVAAHEQERIIGLLKGIDQDECESDDGWWETSMGAKFGATILEQIRGAK